MKKVILNSFINAIVVISITCVVGGCLLDHFDQKKTVRVTKIDATNLDSCRTVMDSTGEEWWTCTTRGNPVRK